MMKEWEKFQYIDAMMTWQKVIKFNFKFKNFFNN